MPQTNHKRPREEEDEADLANQSFGGIAPTDPPVGGSDPANQLVCALLSGADGTTALRRVLKGDVPWGVAVVAAIKSRRGDIKKLDAASKQHRFALRLPNEVILGSEEDQKAALRVVSELVEKSVPDYELLDPDRGHSAEKLCRHFTSRSLSNGHLLLFCCDPNPFAGAIERLMWGRAPKPVQLVVRNDVQLFERMVPEKVTMLAAESGAGKTHALLTSNPNRITVLLVLEDDFKPQSEDSDEIKKSFLSFVLREVAKIIAAPKKRLESRGFKRWTDALDENVRQRVHIVIDEAHGRPNFVRFLCRWCVDIGNMLVVEGSPFAGLDAKTIFFLCAGTGLSSLMYDETSSDPKTFQMLTLKPQVLWRALCRSECNSTRYAVLCSIVDAALEHPLLVLLQDNARAAVLCYNGLRKLFEQLVVEGDDPDLIQAQARNVVQRNATRIFDDVTRQFRATNALRGLYPERIRIASLSALQLLYFEKELTSEDSTRSYRSPFPASQLVGYYGVMTDLAMKIESTEPIPEGYVVDTKRTPTPSDEGSQFCVPSCGRYEMTCSSAAMMTSSLEESPLEPSCLSGYAMQRRAAQAVFLAASSCTTYEELYQRLGCNGPPGRPGDRYLFSKVSLIVLQSWLSGAEAHDQMASLPDNFQTYMKKVEEGDAAYVFINQPGAPYADVIFIARGVVLLVQAQDDAPETSFSQSDLLHNLGKCGLSPDEAMVDSTAPRSTGCNNEEVTQMLCAAAGIDRSRVVFALVRSSELPASTLTSLVTVNAPTQYINVCFPVHPETGKRFPQRRDFMYPLPWPPQTRFDGLQATAVPVCSWPRPM